MYLIIETCFENITHEDPSALAFYKTNFEKFCKRPVKEAGVVFMKAKFGSDSGLHKGLKKKRQRLTTRNRMRGLLPWEWEGNYLLEKQCKQTITQT